MKSRSKDRRNKRFALWGAGVLSVCVVAELKWIACSTGHRFYALNGTARISIAAVETTRTPAVVCVGNGGPLESSGVYAHPLGFDGEQAVAHVICRLPAAALSVPYSTDVFSNRRPRRLHGYVWLEQHQEIASACAASGNDAMDVPANALSGYESDSPADWPCFHPSDGASLGYAIAFRSIFSGDTETARIEVIPNGYARQREP